MEDDFNYRAAAMGLASACERGDEEEVEFLLHGNVDVDSRFEVRCPLHAAQPRAASTTQPLLVVQTSLHGVGFQNQRVVVMHTYARMLL